LSDLSRKLEFRVTLSLTPPQLATYNLYLRRYDLAATEADRGSAPGPPRGLVPTTTISPR